MRYLLALAVLCGCAALAQAQIYKWKDANGNMQYSDTPPTAGQGKAQVVDVKSMPVSALPANKYQSQSNGAAASASAPAAADQATSQKDPKACEAAKTRLSFLQNATRLSSINEKGEVEMLDATKKQSEIDKMNDTIKKVCQ